MSDRNRAIEQAKRLLVDSIWKSANLEGLGTTFQTVEVVLNGNFSCTSIKERFFIINMKRAWSFLLEELSYPINIMYLRELNKLVGEGLFSCGSIRTFPVSISGTDWVPDIPDSEKISNSLKFLLSLSDVKLSAVKLFCYICKVQMFPDGNKRVAQLVANKVLIDNGVGIFQISVSALDYFRRLLVEFYESDDSSRLESFLLEYCIVEIDSVSLEKR